MVQHLQNKKTGKMAGSIGDGKHNTPTATPRIPQTGAPKPALPAIQVPESKIQLDIEATKDLGLQYDYKYYGPSYDASVERDGENGAAYATYDGLQISEPINSEDVLRKILSIGYGKPIPENAQNLIYTAQLDNPDTYRIETVNGYYGEEARTSLHPHTIKYITEWYYNQRNTTDQEGILPYIRNRGTETTGLTPVEAIKKQVKETRGTSAARLIANSKQVTPKTVPLNKIDMPPANTLREGTPIRTGPKRNPKTYMGVLIKQPNGRYQLVDGYAQLTQPNHNNIKAHFLVLTETNENS